MNRRLGIKYKRFYRTCSLNREYIVSPDIPFPSYLEQKGQLTQWKKTNPWLRAAHSQVTQDCVKRLHNTWEAFKTRKFGFPRYKKYGRYQSFLFPQFKENPIQNRFIKLPKIGKVEINLHRPIPEGFKVKGVRIVSRVRGAIWYAVVTIQCDVKVPDPLPFGRGIGVDIGLESYLVTSDNFRVRPAKFFRERTTCVVAKRLCLSACSADPEMLTCESWKPALYCASDECLEDVTNYNRAECL